MPNYELYRDDLEQVPEDEAETHKKIIDLMSHEHDLTREKYGRSLRTSHAKAHAVLKGTLTVRAGLPRELAQGLFAQPGTYDVLVRMASAPGELLDDSKVNATRGMSIKVLGVSGLKLPGHSADTQDFVLSPGKAFIAPNGKAFLQAFKPNADIAPKLSDTTKGIVSDIARVTNSALNAIGANSGKLDFYGHAKLHPLAEVQYSQTPYRYGDYVAKFAVAPATPGLQALLDQKMEIKTHDALREDVAAYMRAHDAVYSFQVQLKVSEGSEDNDDMPIEDATVEWPETMSQYQEVATLTLPPQAGWTPELDAFAEPLSFSPDHALAAHRPLGSVNRARMAAYAALSATRRRETNASVAEPTSTASFPA